jgi:hypothetical protein
MPTYSPPLKEQAVHRLMASISQTASKVSPDLVAVIGWLSPRVLANTLPAFARNTFLMAEPLQGEPHGVTRPH